MADGDDDVLEQQQIPAGFRVVPGGLVNTCTGQPGVITAYFPQDTNPRCGDRVQVTTMLTAAGFDGTVDFAYAAITGAAINTQREAVAGHAVVVNQWVCKKGDDNWNDDPDVKCTAVFKTPDGAEQGRADTAPNVRIVRPINAISRRNIRGGSRSTPQWVQNAAGVWALSGTNYGWSANFDVEFRDGVVIVTGRLKLVPVGSLIVTNAMKSRWKAEIERYWSEKFRAHRRACGRGQACDCTHACCLYDVKIVCEFVTSYEHAVVNVHPGACTGPWGSASWWYSNTWWEQKSANVPAAVRAHEFGHNIGLFDEYKGGATAPGVDPNRYREPTWSIMNAGSSPRAGHFSDWLGALGYLVRDHYQALRKPRP